MNGKLKFFLKCLGILLLCWLVNFCSFNDLQSYTRVALHEMYESEENIDLIMLGSSSVYRGLDPNTADAMLQQNTFNLGTSAQQMRSSYYLLKEACRYHDVKTVVLDVSYVVNTAETEGTTQAYIVTDYTKSSADKVQFLWDTFGFDGFLNDLFPALHTHIKSFDPQLIGKLIVQHITGEYKKGSYEFVTYDNEAYAGKGFVDNYEVISDDHVFKTPVEIDSDKPISNYAIEQLNNIVTYCKEHDIQLILIEAPIPDATLLDAGNYQNYIDAISAYANENDLPYYNFNLAKSNLLQIEYSDILDDDHLNGTGAEKYTEAFCKVLNAAADGESMNNYFYDDYASKVAGNPDGTITR